MTAFKAPLWGNEAPAPLAPPSTGNPKIDSALLVMHSGSVHEKKTSDVARKLGPDVLVAMLDEKALEIGHAEWNDDKIKRLGVADRKAQKKIYEQTTSAINARIQWINWLVAEVAPTPQGAARLVEIVAGEYPPQARQIAAQALWRQKLDDATLREAARTIDLIRWDGEGDEELVRLQHAYAFGVDAAVRVDPKATLFRYGPLIDAKRVKTSNDEARATAVLLGLKKACDVIPPAEISAWTPLVIGLCDHDELDNYALFVLEKLPPDPAVIDPLLRKMGGNPKKVSYFNGTAIKVLARVADARVVPYLVAALQDSWMNFPAAFEGFRVAGDPAMISVIEEWLKKNGDGPRGERTKLGQSVIADLKKKKSNGTATKYKASASGLFDKKEPERKRPTLVFAKGPKPDKPALEPIASQEKATTKLFADAKLNRQTAPPRACATTGRSACQVSEGAAVRRNDIAEVCVENALRVRALEGADLDTSLSGALGAVGDDDRPDPICIPAQ